VHARYRIYAREPGVGYFDAEGTRFTLKHSQKRGHAVASIALSKASVTRFLVSSQCMPETSGKDDLHFSSEANERSVIMAQPDRLLSAWRIA
jgi:hypothetical protein